MRVLFAAFNPVGFHFIFTDFSPYPTPCDTGWTFFDESAVASPANGCSSFSKLFTRKLRDHLGWKQPWLVLKLLCSFQGDLSHCCVLQWWIRKPRLRVPCPSALPFLHSATSSRPRCSFKISWANNEVIYASCRPDIVFRSIAQQLYIRTSTSRETGIPLELLSPLTTHPHFQPWLQQRPQILSYRGLSLPTDFRGTWNQIYDISILSCSQHVLGLKSRAGKRFCALNVSEHSYIQREQIWCLDDEWFASRFHVDSMFVHICYLIP